MVCLLAGHNGQQDVIAVADAANALKCFCYLHLLGMELCCVVKVLEVTASTGAKVRAGSFCRVGMLLEGSEFAGLSISCRAAPTVCSSFWVASVTRVWRTEVIETCKIVVIKFRVPLGPGSPTSPMWSEHTFFDFVNSCGQLLAR